MRILAHGNSREPGADLEARSTRTPVDKLSLLPAGLPAMLNPGADWKLETLAMPDWTVIAVIESIPDHARQLDLLDAIERVGGWRGLFDPYCWEWGMADIEAKVDMVDRILQETGLSLALIVRAFQETYRMDRPDVARSAPEALCVLLEAALARRADGWTRLSQGNPG